MGLGVLNRSEVVLNFVAGEQNLELLVNELGFVVSHHEVWYPETGKNVPPNEFSSLGSCDGG